MKIKYAIITNEINRSSLSDCHDAAGFYQCLQFFNGRILYAPGQLDELSCQQWDVLHVRLSEEDKYLPVQVRKILGKQSRTLLIVSLDIPPGFREASGLDSDCLRSAAEAADFIFATEYAIADSLEKETGKRVYEIPYPADIRLLKQGMSRIKKIPLAVLGYPGMPDDTRCREKLSRLVKSPVHLIVPDNQAATLKRGTGIIVHEYTTDIMLRELISECSIIIIPASFHDYGKPVIYAAASGAIVIGHDNVDAIRRCYPFSSTENFNPMNLFFFCTWLRRNSEVRNFLIEHAHNSVEYYNWNNVAKRFLDFLFDQTKDHRFDYHRQENVKRDGIVDFYSEMKLLSGPKDISYNCNEFSVVCIVKNGTEYLAEFLKYYRNLGARHFFFIDNGSTDNTVDILVQQEDVTLYQSFLPHKKYESEMRRVILNTHCRGKWSLCVDIDEFFDYPFSNMISMKQLLAYLNENNYTAVVSNLLDMFPGHLDFRAGKDYVFLPADYPYCDISKIQKVSYWNHRAFVKYNRLPGKNIRIFFGGIRRKKFRSADNKYLLSKHSLVFIDHKLEAVTNPHYCSRASVADITALLCHYKFVPSFFRKAEEIVKSGTYVYWAEQEYKAYYTALMNKSRIRFYSRTSIKYDMDRLIRKGFVTISESYISFKNDIANKSRETGN